MKSDLGINCKLPVLTLVLPLKLKQLVCNSEPDVNGPPEPVSLPNVPAPEVVISADVPNPAAYTDVPNVAYSSTAPAVVNNLPAPELYKLVKFASVRTVL